MAKNAANGGSKKINKSAWIRSQPASAKAADVVAKAKAEGIKLTLAQVYVARSAAKNLKKAAPKAKGKPGRPKGSKNKPTLKTAVAGDLEHLKRAVFEHGFTKVESFLAELKTSVGL